MLPLRLVGSRMYIRDSLSAWPEDALYEKIFAPYKTNPVSAMPAFGKNGWLSDSEIKALVAYLKTIN